MLYKSYGRIFLLEFLFKYLKTFLNFFYFYFLFFLAGGEAPHQKNKKLGS